MSPQSAGLRLCWVIVALNFLPHHTFGINPDGFWLLAFKHSIISDPLYVLESWDHTHETPCSWRGVRCAETSTADMKDTVPRVIRLALPNSQLQGPIPASLGNIEYLQSLDLSNNSLNGSLPNLLLNATELWFLDLSNNWISGVIPNSIGKLKNLQYLNLSGNALAGNVPANLTTMQNLTVVSLKNNYLTGNLPGGFDLVKVLDLSSNLISGPLPPDFGGASLRYLNISYNGLSGEIPPGFAEKIPGNSTIDISFNRLTGAIPHSVVFMNQDSQSFSGNPYLCGPPSRNPCPIPSTPSIAPTTSSPTSPPAFAVAAIPEDQDSQAGADGSNLAAPGTGSHPKTQTFLRPETIIGIIIGDLVGIGILASIFLYVCRHKRRKNAEDSFKQEDATANSDVSSSTTESKGFARWACLRKRTENGVDSETSSSTDDDVEEPTVNTHENQRQQEPEQSKEGTLVTVDGGKELELETLLKASAYILGATGSSIMYKAVLEDGSALAVRRIGENNMERFKDFENQVRSIAKLVHPNLVRIRGFYWGHEEKLIIYDFVPNGSLANARHRKLSTSPSSHLPWEARLKIAKGVARGLAYLHEKKHVHGNLKPSNVLLGNDMEPKIGDFGLERLVSGDTVFKAGGSARNFGSKRSTASRDSSHEFSLGPSPSPSPSPSGIGSMSAYHAPESLRSIKPNPKWDAYSFGMILLELLTGKAVSLDEMGQANGLLVEDKARALRMADVAIRADMEDKEEFLLACFKLGYSCVTPLSQKRPSMKDVLHVLDKIPSTAYRFGN